MNQPRTIPAPHFFSVSFPYPLPSTYLQGRKPSETERENGDGEFPPGPRPLPVCPGPALALTLCCVQSGAQHRKPYESAVGVESTQLEPGSALWPMSPNGKAGHAGADDIVLLAATVGPGKDSNAVGEAAGPMEEQQQAHGVGPSSTLVATRSQLNPMWMHSTNAHGVLPRVEVRAASNSDSLTLASWHKTSTTKD